MKTFKLRLLYVVIISSFLYSCENELISNESINIDENLKSSNLVSGPIGFEQSGPVGGGFPNVVTWDPNVPGKIYFGADIGGTGQSADYGKSFESSAQGLGYQTSHSKIATLNAVDVNGNTVIVGGTGFKGIGGEVISSIDGGDFWNHDSSDISFSAQNSDAPLPTGRPRSTDSSLIQWLGESTWVAGTYKDGLWISSDDRLTWNRLNVFTGDVYIRSLALSPTNSNSIYVGLWGDDASLPNKGLWEVNNVTGTPSASRVAQVPDVVESMVVLGDRIYIACGIFGVRRFEPAKNNKVTNITGELGTNVMATAIHGYEGKNRPHDRVVVGTAEGFGNIFVSDNGGRTWTNTTSSGVDVSPWGSNDDLLVFNKHPNWALGKEQCDVASVQVSPHDPDAWVVCSTSAIWTTDDAGQTWRPANGFQILSYRDVAISQTGVIAAGNVDHDILVSNNSGLNWTSIGLSGVTVSHALTFSPDGNELAFSNNERDNNTSVAKMAVLSSPETPSTPGLMEIDNPAATKRVAGLTWVDLPDGSDRLIAAMDNGGVRTNDRVQGNWSGWNTRTTSFMKSQANVGLRCSIVSNGGSTIFIYDRKSGVWRSTDYGENWTRILSENAGENKGYLAYDDANDNLYVSTNNQVLRFNNASISNSYVNLSIPTGQPGAMSLDPEGSLWVFGRPLGSGRPVCYLYKADNPDTENIMWTDMADDKMRKVAPIVTDLEVSSNRIVMVTSGKGMLVSLK